MRALSSSAAELLKFSALVRRGVSTHCVELRAVGQGRECIPQLGVGVAIEVPLAVETAPTGKDGQGKHLAAGEGGFGTGPSFWRSRVAEVVDDDVECGEEGVHIDHEESVPFPSGWGGKPTLKGGHLPLKSSPDNSHQAFKKFGVSKKGLDTWVTVATM